MAGATSHKWLGQEYTVHRPRHYSRLNHFRTLMDLLIVRHAIAFERNPRRWRDDGERPLSPEGMVRARKAAAGLRQITERPQCVLTSPLMRARQTATILTE